MLSTLLLSAFLQHTALLSTGERIPCTKNTQVGDSMIENPWGRIHLTDSSVLSIHHGAKEVQMLRAIRNTDFPAWVKRCSDRGHISELVLRANNPADPLDDDSWNLLLSSLEQWGKRIDPLPIKTRSKDRISKLWAAIPRAETAQAALLSGRLLAEISGPQADPKNRLTLTDLRRGIRHKKATVRRAASILAAHQLESDMMRPMLGTSLEDKSPSAYMASAKSMLTLDPDRSLSLWSQSLFRDSSTQNRLRAVQHLASSGKSQAMDSLILAIGAARRAPGRFAFFGKQVSLVTDFDVEVAQAASIADPVTNVITEGSVLEVRIISTRVSRAAMKGMHRLSGEDPGSTEEDWLRWWREKKIGD